MINPFDVQPRTDAFNASNYCIHKILVRFLDIFLVLVLSVHYVNTVRFDEFSFDEFG